jgi:hypothetical protein
VNFLKNILGPANALLLLFDPVTEDEGREAQSQIEVLQKHYELVKVSTLVENLKNRRFRGQAAVSFRNARKGIFRVVVPFLRDHQIPFTIFVRSEELGTGRLPLEDEIRAFVKAYPDKVAPVDAERLLSRTWSEPELVRRALLQWRSNVGPLPITQMEAAQFPPVWGKLIELPRTLFEVGIHIAEKPFDAGALKMQNDFIKFHMGYSPLVAFSTGFIENEVLTEQGIRGCVSVEKGIINKKTDPMRLPYWCLELADEEKSFEEKK